MNAILNRTLGLQKEFVANDFFEAVMPANGASFLYDAVIATGIAACNKVSIQAVDFQGASGRFDLRGRSLDPDGVTYGVFEIQLSSSGNDTATEIPTYEAILRDMTKDGMWGDVTSTDNQESSDYPIQSQTAVIVSLVLASTALTFSLGSCFFIFYYRNNRIVSVGQPPFLYMICFGSILVSFSLYFTAVLNGGQGQQFFDAACIASTWTSYMGQIIVYMALFSKLWRVAKVSQFRRGQRILAKHVMGPFLAMIVGAIVVLVVWTVVDPPHWDYERTNQSWVESNGDIGTCNKDQVFALVMAVLITVSVTIALWMSCRTRELPEDISDSRRVCQTLTVQFLLSLVGCILICLSFTLEKDSLLFASSVVLDFLFSVTSIAFLVIPKMYYVRHQQLTGELPPGLRRGATRVSGFVMRPTNIGDCDMSALSRPPNSGSSDPSSTAESTAMASMRNFRMNMGRRASTTSLPRASSTGPIQTSSRSLYLSQRSLNMRGSTRSIQQQARNDGDITTTPQSPNATVAAEGSTSSIVNQSTGPITTRNVTIPPESILSSVSLPESTSTPSC